MTVLSHRVRRLDEAKRNGERQTQDVLAVGTRTLDELAQAVNDSHKRVLGGLATALREAINSGEALLEAQRQLEVGSFGSWLGENCVVTLAVAMGYMRLAEFSHLLPEEFTNPQIVRQPNGKYSSTATVEKATAYLHAIGAKRATGNMRRKADYREVRRLREEGMSKQAIGELLGISKSTVDIALMSAERRKEFRAQVKRRTREKARAVKAQKRLNAAKNVGGDLAEAYSLIRRCLQHVQAAYSSVPPSKARRTLQGALTHLYESEDAIGRSIKDAEIEIASAGQGADK